LLSAAIVLIYTLLGGLTSAIYNEVVQFFLIVLGFAPLSILAVSKAGGWRGISTHLQPVMTHSWHYVTHASENPMGVELFGLLAGLGFVLSFGYWCTNFLVVQRAMAAETMAGARQTPLIAAFPKIFMPFVVIFPGIAAVALMNMSSGYTLPLKPQGGYDYDQVLTTLMAQFYPSGVLGIGMTALMASFMSGMAGNVTAFNTVFTYDLYQSYIRRNAPDRHYLWVGRVTTVAGVALSIGTAYLATYFNNIMDFLQLVFAFVNAPLFATFLLGMFWKRTTSSGAFWGLLTGLVAGALTLGLTVAENKGGWIAQLHQFPSSMAQNFWIAIISWCACFIVTLLVSLATKPKPESELHNLVYGVTDLPHEGNAPWYKRPGPLAVVVIAVLVIMNIIFW
jgi:SSS family solute:Na+ symporter